MRWERAGWSVNFNSSWEENNFAYDFFRVFVFLAEAIILFNRPLIDKLNWSNCIKLWKWNYGPLDFITSQIFGLIRLELFFRSTTKEMKKYQASLLSSSWKYSTFLRNSSYFCLIYTSWVSFIFDFYIWCSDSISYLSLLKPYTKTLIFYSLSFEPALGLNSYRFKLWLLVYSSIICFFMEPFSIYSSSIDTFKLLFLYSKVLDSKFF